MKKIAVILFASAALYFTACGNDADRTENKDTSYSEPPSGPAPDNSNATNPSLGDTTYTDSTRVEK